MNKQFIITNFAAFALMLFLPTGCRQADGKQDAVQSYRVIKVAASPVEISESYSAAIRGRQDVDIMPQISGRIIRLCVKEGEDRSSIGSNRPSSLSGRITYGIGQCQRNTSESGNGKNRTAGQAGVV